MPNTLNIPISSVENVIEQKVDGRTVFWDTKRKCRIDFISSPDKSILITTSSKATAVVHAYGAWWEIEQLKHEGVARDLVRLIQDTRKVMHLQLSDRVDIGLDTDSEDINGAIYSNVDFIKSQCLIERFSTKLIDNCEVFDGDIGGIKFKFCILVR